MNDLWPTCYCPAGRLSGHPRHAGCWPEDKTSAVRVCVHCQRRIRPDAQGRWATIITLPDLQRGRPELCAARRDLLSHQTREEAKR